MAVPVNAKRDASSALDLRDGYTESQHERVVRLQEQLALAFADYIDRSRFAGRRVLLDYLNIFRLRCAGAAIGGSQLRVAEMPGERVRATRAAR
jgi:hypothetical protein